MGTGRDWRHASVITAFSLSIYRSLYISLLFCFSPSIFSLTLSISLHPFVRSILFSFFFSLISHFRCLAVSLSSPERPKRCRCKARFCIHICCKQTCHQCFWHCVFLCNEGDIAPNPHSLQPGSDPCSRKSFHSNIAPCECQNPVLRM